MKKFFLPLLLVVFAIIFTGCKQDNLPSATLTSISPAVTLTATPVNTKPVAEATKQPSPTNQPSPTLEPTIIPPTPTPASERTAEPTPTEALVVSNAGTTPSIADCLDEADFLEDITIPDNTSFNMGDAFEKIWRIKNTGACPWKNYSLVYAKGDIMSASFSNPIPDTEPGMYSDVSVSMIAPDRGGLQTGYWTIQNSNGNQFGFSLGGIDLIWVQIAVQWPTPQPGNQPAPTSSPVGSCGATRNTDYENQILTFVNNARASRGLNQLELQNQLTQAAVVQSLDMACQDFVDHNGSDGSTWYDRVQSQGYASYITARENIYVGNPEFGGTPPGAFDWWMNSQVHRDNILFPHVSQIGIAYIYNPNSTYGGYYTLVVARP